jgi:hypothetical protein
MPQFDIFSFFSQLFWVLIGFSYLYLLLCFYILPAFAITLKLRSRKLNQVNTNSNTTGVVIGTTDNSPFYDTITQKLSGIVFIRNNALNDINSWFFPIITKNEAFANLVYVYKQKFRIIALFY